MALLNVFSTNTKSKDYNFMTLQTVSEYILWKMSHRIFMKAEASLFTEHYKATFDYLEILLETFTMEV